MPRSYHQGKFTPKFPEKYIGDVTNIVYRSSWERRIMNFFDNTPSIIKWNSESIVIPYISPVDMKQHRYFVDFGVIYKTKTGEIKKALVEIKPHSQRKPPVPPKSGRHTPRFINECKTYSVNQAKWAYATKWCEERKMSFLVLDEFDIGLEKRK